MIQVAAYICGLPYDNIVCTSYVCVSVHSFHNIVKLTYTTSNGGLVNASCELMHLLVFGAFYRIPLCAAPIYIYNISYI